MKELLTILAAIPGALILFSLFPLIDRFTYEKDGKKYVRRFAGLIAFLCVPAGYGLMYIGVNFADTYISANWPSL